MGWNIKLIVCFLSSHFPRRVCLLIQSFCGAVFFHLGRVVLMFKGSFSLRLVWLNLLPYSMDIKSEKRDDDY
ncbi:hypothetical protein N431DRAFT_211263 [Stipitochalara longipes BDJ]|nr:hypothetical protein N431DRAFT_211263 [Stipitochalara longipes BDJ]